MGIFEKNENTEKRKHELKPVSEESAKEQLNCFFEYYDFKNCDDFFSTLIDEEDKKDYSVTINRLLRGIKKGKLSIAVDDNGELLIEQILRDGQKLTYSELTGKHKSQMKSKNNFQAAQELVGALTNVGYAKISNLKTNDLSISESVGMLFLLM